MKRLFTANFLKQFVVYFFTILEGLLIIRVVLKFMAANPSTEFVKWLYDTTHPLVYPFMGMFPSHIGDLRAEIEFSTLFGMLVYALIAYAILYFISIVEKPKR